MIDPSEPEVTDASGAILETDSRGRMFLDADAGTLHCRGSAKGYENSSTDEYLVTRDVKFTIKLIRALP